MSPAKSAVAGLAVGLIAYFGASWLGAKPVAQIGADVAPTLAPNNTEVPKLGTKYGTKSGAGAKTVAPTLAPIGTAVAPTPSVSVTPRISTPSVPSQSPASSLTPRVSVTPNPTPTPSTTPAPTSVPSLTPAPKPVPTTSPTATPSSAPTESPTLTPTPIGTSRVVINEIAWMGTQADANDEWIELYNAGNGSADISGWTLEAVDGIPKINLLGTINAHEYWLLERTSSTSTDIAGDGIYSGALGNVGEELVLRDSSGAEVDRVGPGAWYAGDNASKSSMERIDALKSGYDASNWATWGTIIDAQGNVISTGKDALGTDLHGTPKYKNSVTP